MVWGHLLSRVEYVVYAFVCPLISSISISIRTKWAPQTIRLYLQILDSLCIYMPSKEIHGNIIVGTSDVWRLVCYAIMEDTGFPLYDNVGNLLLKSHV